MRIGVVTLFPELLQSFAETSLVGRAIGEGLLQVSLESLRTHGVGRYQSVDDAPYGGGAGMVLRVDCVVGALEALEASTAASDAGRAHRVLLTPQGQPFHQAMAERWSALPAISLVCGRYEGFDERVREHVDEEVSLGDFVLIGGEVAAMAMIECCARLLPGVLGNSDSMRDESFSPSRDRGLEYPQYTRPSEFRGSGVPAVLKGGNHAEIERWRTDAARERTRQRRPDLVTSATPKGTS